MATKKTRTPVTTRRGDGGYTSLWGGDEVPKYDPRPEAFGTIDEASAILGQARTQTRHAEVGSQVLKLQNDLFRLMSELAAGTARTGEYAIGPDNVVDIESRIIRVREACELPEMFTISATPTSAVLDIARTVIRRAERLVVRMLHEGLIENADSVRFLNRASDMAFLLARYEEKLDGVPYQTIGARDLD